MRWWDGKQWTDRYEEAHPSQGFPRELESAASSPGKFGKFAAWIALLLLMLVAVFIWAMLRSNGVPDCSARVDFVWLESGSSDRYSSATNPAGDFCAVAEGEGILTFSPDGQGGGTLAGTLAVYPNIAGSQSFDGVCPPPERVGSYVLEGVNGQFSGSVSNGSLSGSGTFAHRQLPIAISITATAESG